MQSCRSYIVVFLFLYIVEIHHLLALPAVPLPILPRRALPPDTTRRNCEHVDVLLARELVERCGGHLEYPRCQWLCRRDPLASMDTASPGAFHLHLHMTKEIFSSYCIPQ